LPVTEDDAALLAALGCQIEMQVPSEDISDEPVPLSSFELRLKSYVPPNVLESSKEQFFSKSLGKRVMEEHKRYRGFTEKDCKHRFVEKCQTLPSYSFHFYVGVVRKQ